MSWGRRVPTGGSWSWRKPVPPPPTPTPVVVIDEDDVDDSEVFIINDAAEIARAEAACKSKKGSSSGSNVINIDDDEEEDGGGGRGGDRAGPSTAGAGGSPATRTPPAHGSARNRYGLNYVSDSDQSDLSDGSDSDSDGGSDCEILHSWAARKVWEKAASRRTAPQCPPKRKDGGASTSASSAESSTHHGENLEDLFASECPLDDDILESFSDTFNSAGPSSANGAKHGAGPSTMRNVQECQMDHDSDGRRTEECDPTTSSLNPDRAANDEATHSPEAPAPKKAAETSHPPRPDETLNPEGYTSYNLFSKNRVFPSCSADWKDNDLIFVSTSEKMVEKKMCFAPDDDSLMDQLPEDPVSMSRHGCFRQSGEYLNMTVPKNDTLETCPLSQNDFGDDPGKLGLSAVVQDGPDIKDGLMGAREKHKESDEYKRAEEEEWASRQRQLAIQAEEAKEAKRFRKRKKAEALRLLDMQKRQKQRLEEVRETQRKGEEDIQLKEQCRGAVRLELENIGRTCTDVSSVLRALGIPVQGSEVKAAYKRALLKFHPDRVSRTDIYQQVKAEETFKFISRFKEKLQL